MEERPIVCGPYVKFFSSRRVSDLFLCYRYSLLINIKCNDMGRNHGCSTGFGVENQHHAFSNFHELWNPLAGLWWHICSSIH